MFKINNWKQPIYKEDCISVILNGLITAILAGALSGALDCLLEAIYVPISFGLIIVTMLVSMRIKKAYNSYHILYPVLAIVFFFVALFVADMAYALITYANVPNVLGNLFSNPLFYLDFILEPFNTFIIYLRLLDFVGILLSALNIIIIIGAVVYCYKNVKGNN